MTHVGATYGGALYELCRDENLDGEVLEEITALGKIFRENQDFLRLLSVPSLSTEERTQVLDQCFDGRVHLYLLNFLKILAEKGYFREYFNCADTYQARYDEDHQILRVKATTAVPLSDIQGKRLAEILEKKTGKHVCIDNHVDPLCMGGVRLDWDDRRMEDTIANRLRSMRSMLLNTQL